MVLQDARSVYGAVLQGYYIVVDGTCLTRKDLLELFKHVGKDSYYYPHSYMDQEATDIFPCHDHHPDDAIETNPNRNHIDTKIQKIDEWHGHRHWDFCLFLNALAWDDIHGKVGMLILNWVDKEAHIGRRVGYLVLRLRQIRELGYFDMVLRNVPWKR